GPDRLASGVLDERRVYRAVLGADRDSDPLRRTVAGVLPDTERLDVGRSVGLDGVEREPLLLATVLDPADTKILDHALLERGVTDRSLLADRDRTGTVDGTAGE